MLSISRPFAVTFRRITLLLPFWLEPVPQTTILPPTVTLLSTTSSRPMPPVR